MIFQGGCKYFTLSKDARDYVYKRFLNLITYTIFKHFFFFCKENWLNMIQIFKKGKIVPPPPRRSLLRSI